LFSQFVGHRYKICLVARSSLITNSIIEEMINWYKVLKDLPMMQEVQLQSEKAFAIV